MGAHTTRGPIKTAVLLTYLANSDCSATVQTPPSRLLC